MNGNPMREWEVALLVKYTFNGFLGSTLKLPCLPLHYFIFHLEFLVEGSFSNFMSPLLDVINEQRKLHWLVNGDM
jgi:hypothetical protein